MSPLPESKTDVLIIGAGPAGLMAALWMAKCGIDFRIIDKRATKVFKGQADSLQARTMEILDSFGIADAINKRAAHLLETQFWASGENGDAIEPVGTASEYHPDLSRFHQVLINQGQIERTLLDAIKSLSNVRVERGVAPTHLHLDSHASPDDPRAHPVAVTLRHLTEAEMPRASVVPQPGSFGVNPGDEAELEREPTGKEGAEEVVRARYVLGCDGARSWTRRQVGIELVGEGRDALWGAADGVPDVDTDFPDLGVRVFVNTARGSMMTVPRENGMIRVGVKLDGDVDRSLVSPEMVMARAQELLAPYKIGFAHCDWHAVYQSNQRLGTAFSRHERVFLAGDAVHTHSPKAGIGLNFSLQDTYNLGWKVAHVIKGIAKPSILKTYETERREVAQQLIRFDEDFSAKLSSGEDVQKAFADALPFTSCTSIEYGPSMIVAKTSAGTVGKQELAQHIVVGRRFPSQQVVSQASGCPLQFQERFPSDGKYRVVVFAGDIARTEQLERVEVLGRTLSLSRLFSKRHSSRQEGEQGVFDVLVLHSSRREDVRFCKLPSTLCTHSRSNVYADNIPYVGGLGTAYQSYGVDRLKGCIVAVRPDGHVMFVGEFEDAGDLNEMFSEILL
ncbi:Phenol 2-monooxygenase [Diplodia seriata]|uniref:Phenol 2-monooxygenase n=1 Tax=Diplodia seriata TaxID=420778 RepID=A0A1S8B9N7_9PEZI|nr:Phenol 2-monooxygenase [Diplodia seriata]